MKYFSQDFLDFFIELAPNNNKDWFDQNRSRYEESVREPMKVFVAKLIENLKKDDKKINIEPKDAIFRINRDIRFAKDKTPYKLNTSAVISRGGRKDHTTPGVYVELNPENLRIYGGVYSLDKDQIYDIREFISNNLKRFDNLLSDPVFKKHYGEIHGESIKRIPKEFKEAYEQQPLIANKNWYYFAKLDPEIIVSDKLEETVMEYYEAGKKMMNFFKEALNVI